MDRFGFASFGPNHNCILLSSRSLASKSAPWKQQRESRLARRGQFDNVLGVKKEKKRTNPRPTDDRRWAGRTWMAVAFYRFCSNEKKIANWSSRTPCLVISPEVRPPVAASRPLLLRWKNPDEKDGLGIITTGASLWHLPFSVCRREDSLDRWLSDLSTVDREWISEFDTSYLIANGERCLR